MGIDIKPTGPVPARGTAPVKPVVAGSAMSRQALPGTGNHVSDNALGEAVTNPPSEMVSRAVSHLSEYAQAVKRDLHFSVDETSGRTVVRVVDGATGEVIRQIPNEEVLAIAQGLTETQGLLLKARA